MKTRLLDRNRATFRGSRKGIALIIVLASLVLLTLLVVAFLSNVGTELKSSKIYANGATVKLLSQSAVNLVQSEINDATHDGTLAWTSQPGMIRTFDNTGVAVKYYKLYSDDAMVKSGAYNSATGTPPADWYNKAGVYVDLNQPVAANGVNRYPIVDGDSADLIKTTATTVDTTTGVPVGASILGPVYTDAANKKQPQVAGFWINGTAPLQPSTANQAPMPVKWLYVLRDGSVVVPDSTLSPTGATTFTGGGTASQPDKDAKQIVGRVAFWTDDDTSKVNINTAGEGAAVWDTPRFRASDYSTLTLSQPVQNEFQRYPGHPSTVSLSSVFGNFVTDGASQTGSLSFPENIYPLTPRIQQGGSVHGTVKMTDAANKYNVNTALATLPVRTDRLYDTVDEFMFQNSRALNSLLLNSTSSLDQAKIEKAKFFITASSRAPDVNLFNQPRVSVWPVWEPSAPRTAVLPWRSPKDQLISFCTTVNNFPYYFVRKDPNDPDTDLPKTDDGTPLGHNRQLLEYLRNSMTRSIPGFGGSFAGKYNFAEVVTGSAIAPASGATEKDQILTEIFDYIRSTNLKDQSLATTTGNGGIAVTNPVTTYTGAIVPSAVYPYAGGGGGQVVPIVDLTNQTRGFGRFPTLQQAALIFYASKDDGSAVAASPGPPPVPYSPPKATEMKAFFVLQLFNPASGYPGCSPYYKLEVSGLSSFTWDGTTQMFPNDSAILPSVVTNGIVLLSMMGGIESWRRVMHGGLPAGSFASFFSNGYPTAIQNPSNSAYTLAAPGPGLTGIHFTGGPVTVKFYQNLADGTRGKLLQTIKFTFPPAPAVGFPLPLVSAIAGHSTTWQNWTNRWANEGNSFGTVTSDNDVIRSVVATPGDMRLVAARQTIDDTVNTANTFFGGHPAYNSANGMAHDLQTSFGDPDFNGSMALSPTGTLSVGRLVPVSYSGAAAGWCGKESSGMGKSAFWSDVPTSAGVAVGKIAPFAAGDLPGDWDNGTPSQRDGAFINKPDEGEFSASLNDGAKTKTTPYWAQSYSAVAVGETFFSPNRMIPSPGMMGSLPTGVLANRPWQTLLFRPGPIGHPGLGTSVNLPVAATVAGGDQGPPYTANASTATVTQGPPDHLLLDLFTMPVVEPYAISEPLATSGRVNMNYQLIPFTYINRNTAVQAALKGVQVISVPDTDAVFYKYDDSVRSETGYKYRLNLDMAKTFYQFETRFKNNDVFRSPSEICSIDLVPLATDYTFTSPPTRADMDKYWLKHRLAGDNSRERPYTNLYPLLTTKSNTFTIHFRVQTLKKVVSGTTNYAQWVEGTDLITGEYRGSQTIERYVDANGATDAAGNTLPNFADPANYSKTLSPYYKFRVVATRQFAP